MPVEQQQAPDVRLIPAGTLRGWPHDVAVIRATGDRWRGTNGSWLTQDEVEQHGERLIPVRPLLELLPELDQLAAEAGSASEEAEVWVRSATDRLCARLGSLLGETPTGVTQ